MSNKPPMFERMVREDGSKCTKRNYSGETRPPKNVTFVELHSSVKEVNAGFGLRKHKSLTEVVFNEGLQKIGDYSFWRCESLESITLPSTLIEIGDHAFYSCGLLKSILLPSNITKIGKFAFCACFNGETSLSIGAHKIAHGSFASCTSLETISLLPTVINVGPIAFYNCQRLREVGLHEGIQKIAWDAFEGCTSLERLIFRGLSTRLNNIIQARQIEVEDKIDNIRGDLVERRGSEIFISEVVWVRVRRLTQGSHWSVFKGRIDRIDKALAYYELKEATTLLELAMWKSKIDQVEVKPSANRDAYRIDIPGPVKSTILQYLDCRV